MQLHEVGQVTQVVGADNANSLLAEGWKLIAVVPAVIGTANGGKPSAMYVLGKAAKKEPKRTPTLTAEDIARANDL